jgi:hypothetical protein
MKNAPEILVGCEDLHGDEVGGAGMVDEPCHIPVLHNNSKDC